MAEETKQEETKTLSVSQLKEGMVLTFNLLDDKGQVVARKGTRIEDKVIEELKKKGEVFFFSMPQKQEEVRTPWFNSQTLQWGQTNTKEMLLDVRNNQVFNRDHLSFVLQFIEEVYDNVKVTRASYINLSATQESKDDWFPNHIINVTLLVLGYHILQRAPKKEAIDAALSAFLHDIGYTVGAWDLLMSTNELSRDETLPLRDHPHKGYELLKDLPISDVVKQGVLFHHERYDDSGYPTTLPYNRLPLLPKIISIADFIEAITNDRPFRKGMGMKIALSATIEQSGKAFDYEVLSRFIRYMGPFLTKGQPFYERNQIVYTNYGETARVINFGKTWMAPEIEILVDEKKRMLSRPFTINLYNDLSRQLAQIVPPQKSAEILTDIMRQTGRYEQFLKEQEDEKKEAEKQKRLAAKREGAETPPEPKKPEAKAAKAPAPEQDEVPEISETAEKANAPKDS